MKLRLSLIRWLASKLPRREILVDGEEYLDRYYIAGPMPDGLARLWKSETPTERLPWLRRTWYLHRFHRPDEDRHLHNHPWQALGLILYGGYIELRSEDGGGIVSRLVKAGDKQVIRPNTYHTISSLLDENMNNSREVWTLFGVGERVQGWGFLVDGEHVPWREYKDL